MLLVVSEVIAALWHVAYREIPILVRVDVPRMAFSIEPCTKYIEGL